jgi:hypothetical protein
MSAGVASVLIGLVLYWLAARVYFDWPFLTQPRVRVLGTVVGHPSISGEGGETPLLTIRFEADSGKTVDVRASLGPWSHQIDVGSTIAVEYPAGYPKKARMLGSRPAYLDYAVCFVVLAVLIAFIASPKWISWI